MTRPVFSIPSLSARYTILGFAAALGLSACAGNSNYAPVVYHHMTDPTDRPLIATGDPALVTPIPKTPTANPHAPRSLAPQNSVHPVQTTDLKPVPTAQYYSDADLLATPEPQYYAPSAMTPVALNYAEFKEPTAPANVSSTPAPDKPYEITVQMGDTLYGLSRLHGIDAASLAQANGLAAPFTLQAGEKLLVPGAGSYTVVRGDTLYSIARAYNVNAGQLAADNKIQPPYLLSTGQVLYLPGNTGHTQVASNAAPPKGVGGPYVRPGAQPKPPASAPRAKPKAKAPAKPKPATGFSWPAKGQVLSEYGTLANGQRNDGINLRLPEGAAIRAARGGEVIYVGSDIQSFGNLILIRHEGGYVTAYAHARRVYVRRGDMVDRGQHVADVGRTGNVGESQLHFEIRKDQKPVNPRRFLPSI